MKVRVEIRQTILHSGEVEMTKERHERLKNMLKMDLVNSLIFRGLNREEDWDIETFVKLGDEE